MSLVCKWWQFVTHVTYYISTVDLSYNTGSVRSSHQTVNNPGSWQPVGASEKSFTFHFWHNSFIFDDVKLAQLFNNSFELKNVTLKSKHTLPVLHFSGGQDPHPPGSTPRACNYILGYYHACTWQGLQSIATRNLLLQNRYRVQQYMNNWKGEKFPAQSARKKFGTCLPLFQFVPPTCWRDMPLFAAPPGPGSV